MELNLKDKSVVITGGATGIGKACALEYLKEGAKVSICNRTQEKLDKAKAEFAELGYEIDAYQTDVGNVDELKAMAAAVVEKNGGIDVWVNNAGIDIHYKALDFPVEVYDQIMRTNVYAVFEGSRIAANYMKEAGNGGVIINIESYTVKIPHTEGSVYAASKAAVGSFTKSFAANLAPYGIRVVGIIPGMIETDIAREAIAVNRDLYTANIAMQRLGQPEDLAKPVVFLSSDCAAYISGVEIEIAGGKYAVQNSRYAWEHLNDML